MSLWTCQCCWPEYDFRSSEDCSVTIDKSMERWSRVTNASMHTLREIISDGRFESDSRALLRKPDFFFGNSTEEDEAVFYDGDYKWLRQIGNRRFFLSNMERMYPLAYLQHISVHRTMDWELVKPISGISLVSTMSTQSVMGGTCLGCSLNWSELNTRRGDSTTSSHLYQIIPGREE